MYNCDGKGRALQSLSQSRRYNQGEGVRGTMSMFVPPKEKSLHVVRQSTVDEGSSTNRKMVQRYWRTQN